MVTDYTRQGAFIDPSMFGTTSCSIIGCGATGSHVGLALAMTGFGDANNGQGVMKLFDFDIVEEHNLPNQAFHTSHLGKNKAVSLAQLIQSKSGFLPNSYPIRVTDQEIVASDYVFLLVDTMKARREIAEDLLSISENTRLVIETRMGLTEGYVYAWDPRDPVQHKAWVDTLFDDDKAQVSACGTSMSCGVTAMLIASLAVTRMIQDFDWWNGKKYLESQGFKSTIPFESAISFYPERICELG